MFRVWFRRIARENVPVQRVRRFRPRLEPLEDRRLLSAAADLTGNGIPDLVTGGTYWASVFLGNGDGTFQPAVNYLTGDGPLREQIADVNGDGIPDIITSNGNTAATVSVLLGNGDGTFQHKRDFATGAQLGAFDVAVADLTGNGILDIATANANDDTVSVLLGNGDGTFKAPTIYPVGSRPSRIVAGRFGSDSDLPDLAVVNDPSGTSVGAVSVLVNHGDGTFRSPVAYRAGPSPAGIALGDFASTGTLDIAVSDFRSNTVSILMGNGDHTFQPARNISVPGIANDNLVAADFNNDGNLDLAALTFQGGHYQVSVLLGDGTGNFAPPLNTDLGPPSGLTGFTVADFNNDGNLDLAEVTSQQDGSIHVSVLLGNGDGTFTPPLNVHAGPDRSNIAAAELNLDGPADPVTADSVDRAVTVLRNDGSWDTAPRRAETSVDTAKRDAPEQALALVPFPLEDLGSVVGWPNDPYADPFQARR